MPKVTYSPAANDNVILNANKVSKVIATIVEVNPNYVKLITNDNEVLRYAPYQFDDTWDATNQVWDLSKSRPKARF